MNKIGKLSLTVIDKINTNLKILQSQKKGNFQLNTKNKNRSNFITDTYQQKNIDFEMKNDIIKSVAQIIKGIEEEDNKRIKTSLFSLFIANLTLQINNQGTNVTTNNFITSINLYLNLSDSYILNQLQMLDCDDFLGLHKTDFSNKNFKKIAIIELVRGSCFHLIGSDEDQEGREYNKAMKLLLMAFYAQKIDLMVDIETEVDIYNSYLLLTNEIEQV